MNNDNIDLLEVARAVGLRELLHGVSAEVARPVLKRFVEAVNFVDVPKERPPAQAEPSPDTEQPDMRDAYAGAREDLAIWKRRALEAEAINRNLEASLAHADNRATEAEETIQRMCDQHNAENGPTFMGEPVLRDTEQQRRDAMPEIESLIPAGWVFSSADFSRKAMCNDPVGSVVLVRDEAGRKWWHSLDDMGRDQEELYASGWGRTFTDAVKAAAERAQAASAAEGDGDA